MCGRYYVDNESDLVEIRKIFDELSQRYFGQPVLEQLRSGEIYPSQVAPVIRPVETTTGIRLLPDLMQWGFTEPSMLINARAETAEIKPTFRESIRSRRVLIPATSFFEWHMTDENDRKKTKLRLYRPDEPVFYMAGIYRPIPHEHNPLGLPGQFVILTGEANATVSPIHDRMPLIVPRPLLRRYLQDEQAARQILKSAIEAGFEHEPAI